MASENKTPPTPPQKRNPEHLQLTAGETKIVRLGIPQIPGDLSSPPLYDKDVIISTGKNDCISHEKCSSAEIESMRSAFEDKGIYKTRRNENTQKIEIDRYFSDYYRNS